MVPVVPRLEVLARLLFMLEGNMAEFSWPTLRIKKMLKVANLQSLNFDVTGFGKFGLIPCFGGWGLWKKLKFGELNFKTFLIPQKAMEWGWGPRRFWKPNFPKPVISGGVFALAISQSIHGFQIKCVIFMFLKMTPNCHFTLSLAVQGGPQKLKFLFNGQADLRLWL